jgi:hypothetical protein
MPQASKICRLAVCFGFFIFSLNILIIGTNFFYKMKGPHHIGMIGKRYCRHILLACGIYKIGNTYGGL